MIQARLEQSLVEWESVSETVGEQTAEDHGVGEERRWPLVWVVAIVMALAEEAQGSE